MDHHTDRDSHSTGTSMTIGATVGPCSLVLLILVLVFMFYLMRRRQTPMNSCVYITGRRDEDTQSFVELEDPQQNVDVSPPPPSYCAIIGSEFIFYTERSYNERSHTGLAPESLDNSESLPSYDTYINHQNMKSDSPMQNPYLPGNV